MLSLRDQTKLDALTDNFTRILGKNYNPNSTPDLKSAAVPDSTDAKGPPAAHEQATSVDKKAVDEPEAQAFKNFHRNALASTQFVTYSVISGFLVCLFTLIYLQALPQSKDPKVAESFNQVLNIGFGALVSAFTAVVQYWIGSSSGSRAKDLPSGK